MPRKQFPKCRPYFIPIKVPRIQLESNGWSQPVWQCFLNSVIIINDFNAINLQKCFEDAMVSLEIVTKSDKRIKEQNVNAGFSVSVPLGLPPTNTSPPFVP